MSAHAWWLIGGTLLLLGTGALVTRSDSVTLGPFSVRLVGVGVAMAGYYVAVHWVHFGAEPLRPVEPLVLRYAVPVLGVAAALYCIWRVIQSWQSELHGLLKTLLQLLLVLALAAIARLCFSH